MISQTQHCNKHPHNGVQHTIQLGILDHKICTHIRSLNNVVVIVYTCLWPLLVGGVRSSCLWCTSQLFRPSDQQFRHSSGVCPKIQGWQRGVYIYISSLSYTYMVQIMYDSACELFGEAIRNMFGCVLKIFFYGVVWRCWVWVEVSLFLGPFMKQKLITLYIIETFTV